MKTDLERTKEFLDSLGIIYSLEQIGEYLVIGFGSDWYADGGSITLHNDNIDGFIEVRFNKNGKFSTVEAWE